MSEKKSWTHPICSFCWPAFCIGHNGVYALPTALKEPELETCHFCGGETKAGIYVRAEPTQPPYSPHAPVHGST